MRKELVTVNKLKKFARFILDNYLDEFVAEDLKRAHLVNLPLLKLVAHLPEKDQFVVFQKSARDLFLEITEDRVVEVSYTTIENFKQNKIPAGSAS